MNRPFNLLRRLEGLAAGSLAGTHSPAMGTAQSRSLQGLPPTLPAQGTPMPSPLPTPAAQGPSLHPRELAHPIEQRSGCSTSHSMIS